MASEKRERDEEETSVTRKKSKTFAKELVQKAEENYETADNCLKHYRRLTKARKQNPSQEIQEEIAKLDEALLHYKLGYDSLKVKDLESLNLTPKSLREIRETALIAVDEIVGIAKRYVRTTKSVADKAQKKALYLKAAQAYEQAAELAKSLPVIKLRKQAQRENGKLHEKYTALKEQYERLTLDERSASPEPEARKSPSTVHASPVSPKFEVEVPKPAKRKMKPAAPSSSGVVKSRPPLFPEPTDDPTPSFASPASLLARLPAFCPALSTQDISQFFKKPRVAPEAEPTLKPDKDPQFERALEEAKNNLKAHELGHVKAFLDAVFTTMKEELVQAKIISSPDAILPYPSGLTAELIWLRYSQKLGALVDEVIESIASAPVEDNRNLEALFFLLRQAQYFGHVHATTYTKKGDTFLTAVLKIAKKDAVHDQCRKACIALLLAGAHPSHTDEEHLSTIMLADSGLLPLSSQVYDIIAKATACTNDDIEDSSENGDYATEVFSFDTYRQVLFQKLNYILSRGEQEQQFRAKMAEEGLNLELEDNQILDADTLASMDALLKPGTFAPTADTAPSPRKSKSWTCEGKYTGGSSSSSRSSSVRPEKKAEAIPPHILTGLHQVFSLMDVDLDFMKALNPDIMQVTDPVIQREMAINTAFTTACQDWHMIMNNTHWVGVEIPGTGVSLRDKAKNLQLDNFSDFFKQKEELVASFKSRLPPLPKHAFSSSSSSSIPLALPFDAKSGSKPPSLFRANTGSSAASITYSLQDSKRDLQQPKTPQSLIEEAIKNLRDGKLSKVKFFLNGLLVQAKKELQLAETADLPYGLTRPQATVCEPYSTALSKLIADTFRPEGSIKELFFLLSHAGPHFTYIHTNYLNDQDTFLITALKIGEDAECHEKCRLFLAALLVAGADPTDMDKASLSTLERAKSMKLNSEAILKVIEEADHAATSRQLNAYRHILRKELGEVPSSGKQETRFHAMLAKDSRLDALAPLDVYAETTPFIKVLATRFSFALTASTQPYPQLEGEVMASMQFEGLSPY